MNGPRYRFQGGHPLDPEAGIPNSPDELRRPGDCADAGAPAGELKDDPDAKHSQIVCWAVDGDRLMRCHLLLESVDLK